MSNKIKTILILLAIIVIIGVISVGLGSWLTNKPQPTPDLPEPLPITAPQTFESEPTNLSDLFEIELVNNWELELHTPDRMVDRYRFKRLGDETAVFTASIYDDKEIASFDELIEVRYGGAVLESVEDLEINGLQAKRVHANFLGADNNKRSGADMLIKIDENFFISLNGLHVPSGEQDVIITSELDFMQTSLIVL